MTRERRGPSSLIESILDMSRGARDISSIATVSALLTLPTLGHTTWHPSPLPFGPGERITYHVNAKGMGSIGTATMTVEGPVDVRGTPTFLLRSRTTAGFGPFKGSQLSESWFDPVAIRSLRFHERERRLFATHSVRVEIFPDDDAWMNADGDSGVSPTNASLDELSFIYFLRTLPLATDTVYQLNRHFDAKQNPVTIRITRGDSIRTDLGVFNTVLMEMRVRDPHRYHGEGVIRVYLSDDKCRIPVRIASDIPGVGSFVLTLESYTYPASPCDFTRRLSTSPARSN